MELILQLVIIGFLVEAVTDTLKLIYDREDGIQVSKLVALAVGLVLAFVTQKDILVAVKLLEVSNIAGIILTGILVSRGGNFIHELFDRLKGDEYIE